MTNTVRYVKCKDCGRTLPGPPRACDVCGEKMTYGEAEIYRTPEGPIHRHYYAQAKANSEARQSRRNYSPTNTAKSSNRYENAGNENTGYEKNAVKNAYYSFFQDGGRKQKSQKSAGKKALDIGTGVIGVVVAIFVIFGGVIGNFFDDSDWDYDGYSDYDSSTVYVEESMLTDNYDMYLDYIEYYRYDDEANELDIDFEVTVDSDSPVVFNLYNDFEVVIDDEVYSFSEVYVGDGYGDYESIEEDTFTMEPNQKYYFSISYEYEYGSWTNMVIKHNFGGGLANRNSDYDFIINEDYY